MWEGMARVGETSFVFSIMCLANQFQSIFHKVRDMLESAEMTEDLGWCLFSIIPLIFSVSLYFSRAFLVFLVCACTCVMSFFLCTVQHLKYSTEVIMYSCGLRVASCEGWCITSDDRALLAYQVVSSPTPALFCAAPQSPIACLAEGQVPLLSASPQAHGGAEYPGGV